MSDDLLCESDLAVWVPMLSDRRVMVPLSELQSRSGLDRSEFNFSLGRLSDAELLEVCQWGESSYAALSPYAAAREGLKPRRPRRDGSGPRSLVWVSVESTERRERIAGRVEIDPQANPASLADPSAAEPVEVAIASEEVGLLVSEELAKDEAAKTEGKRRRRTDDERNPARLPWPSVVLCGVQPWPPRPIWGDVCPVCRRGKGGRMRGSACCLWCDRWSLDWLLHRMGRRTEKVKDAPKSKLCRA